MSESEGRPLSQAVQQVLHGEYLDLLLVAGRLLRREATVTDATAAATLRAWVLRQLKDCRQKLDLRHFSGAPAVVVEAEIAIIAFLDSAAANAFGLPVWRLLREDLRNDYIDAGREARSVVDLGKYVYERLERLRTHPEILAREPEELLEIYDRCWRLGYGFSYDGRPSEFEDIKTKIAEALSTGAKRHRPSDGMISPLDADPALSPHLPSLTQAAPRALPLSPRILAGLFAAVLLVVTVGLGLAIHRDRTQTDRSLARANHRVGELFSTVDRICPAPGARPATPRRCTSRRARKIYRTNRPRRRG